MKKRSCSFFHFFQLNILSAMILFLCLFTGCTRDADREQTPVLPSYPGKSSVKEQDARHSDELSGKIHEEASEDSTKEIQSTIPEDIPEEPAPVSDPHLSDPSQDPESAQNPGKRDNTPRCLVPVASGEITYGNECVLLDASQTEHGYICVQYTGQSPKVKLQLTGPDTVTYTYNLATNVMDTFPLTGGSGSYQVGVYENISGTQYSTAFYQELSVQIQNEFDPYLYPNQYVDFTPDSLAVAKAAELSAIADTDLDVVAEIYNYVITNVTYDYEKASNIASGYLCDVDATLTSGTGICLDYAALMAAMLRSQGIPTHLEVGYAKEAYHAWISTYVDEKGWINGIIEFDGKSWSLMDPTFAANSSEQSLKKFIGDGSNYTVKYIY